MENISQALLMAAGILLAVLLILIAMILFRGGAEVTNAYQNSNEQNELNTFNSNFTRMLTGNDDSIIPGQARKDTITIYDIISVANFAWNNNCKYVDNPLATEYADDPRMLRISICSTTGSTIIDNLQNYNQELYDIIIKAGHFRDSTQLPQILYYQIEITGYSSAGRINKVKFSPKTDPVAASQISSALSSISTGSYLRNI